MRLILCMLFATCIPHSALAQKCQTGEPYFFEALFDTETCPQDIQAWMDRLNGCSHIESKAEDLNNNEPGHIEILQALRQELHCKALWCDYDALFAKYEGDVIYTSIISNYAQMIFGDQELPLCYKEQSEQDS